MYNIVASFWKYVYASEFVSLIREKVSSTFVHTIPACDLNGMHSVQTACDSTFFFFFSVYNRNIDHKSDAVQFSQSVQNGRFKLTLFLIARSLSNIYIFLPVLKVPIVY